MRLPFLLTIFVLLIPIVLLAQEVDNSSSSEGNQLIYRTEVYGGVFLHTSGYGANIRKSDKITGYSRKIFALDVLNLKHAKEIKTYNPYIDDNRGFVYGKLNSVVVARPSFGYQKIIYTKDAKKGVQISYIVFGGPSLAFQKPVYLEVADLSASSRFGISKTEKFDPERHTQDNIYGKAPLLKGIEETTVLPGLFAKFSLNFDYGQDDLIYRAVETGLSIDAYHKKVPIMAFDTNRQVYFTLFINFHFGKKII